MSKIRFYREGQDEEWVGAGDQHYAYGSNSVRKGEPVLCGHHTCSLTQRAAWGSQDASSCLNLPPPKRWVQQLNPPQLGAIILGSVRAWIWHLWYPWFLFAQQLFWGWSMWAPLHEQLVFAQLLHQQHWPWHCVCIHGVQSLLWYQVMLLLGFLPKKEGNKFVQFSSRNSSKERRVFICLFTGFLAETTACLCLPLKKMYLSLNHWDRMRIIKEAKQLP